MNLGNLKEMNVTARLPKDLFNSLTCFTFVNPAVVDGAPDIVTCNTNGYIYEVKNKIIIGCLKLGEIAKSVCCYYLLANKNFSVFYLVYTSSQRLLIIGRPCKHLKVIQAYGRIKEFQVHDFECVGHPQIKVTFNGEGESAVYEFPVESNIEENVSIVSGSVIESLNEELQILNKHIDDLTEEYNCLKKIAFHSDLQVDLKKVLVGSLTFSSLFTENTQHKFIICDKWHKIYGVHLILGMTLRNNSNKVIRDIQFVIDDEKVTEYCYSFFDPTKDLGKYLFSPRNVSGDVEPGREICVVGGFQVTEFSGEPELSFLCLATSSDPEEILVKETFQLSIWDIASKSTVGLEEKFTVEDLMAIMTVKSETRLRIKSEALKEDSVESGILENLGFKKLNKLKDKLFYCTSTYLKEVFVGLRHVGTNPNVWLAVAYTSESSQVSFLMSALCDLLPDDAEVVRQ